MFNGDGARTAQKQPLTPDIPGVQFRCHEDPPATLRIVPRYAHLGSIVCGDARELPNIQHRASLAWKIFRPLRRKVFTNPFLHRAEKLLLLQQRVFSRFLHGSGLWRLATLQEKSVALEPLSSWIRGSLRALTGITAQELSTAQVAAILGPPLPEELLHVERARALCEVSAIHSPQHWRGILHDGDILPWSPSKSLAANPCLRRLLLPSSCTIQCQSWLPCELICLDLAKWAVPFFADRLLGDRKRARLFCRLCRKSPHPPRKCSLGHRPMTALCAVPVGLHLPASAP